MESYLTKAQDEIAQNRAEIIDKLVQFSLTDMLLFWGQEKTLIERQQETWMPILQWAKNEFDTKFITTNELDVPKENESSGYRLKAFMEDLTDKELTAFYAVALKIRSVLLAAAIVKGHMSTEEAFNAAFLEEVWQSENWGLDEEAIGRREQIKVEIQEIEDFLHS